MKEKCDALKMLEQGATNSEVELCYGVSPRFVRDLRKAGRPNYRESHVTRMSSIVNQKAVDIIFILRKEL